MEKPYILLMYLQRMVYKRTFEYLGNHGLLTIGAYLEERGYRARVFTGITTDGLEVFRKENENYPVFAVGLYCDYDNQSAVEGLSSLLKTSGVHVFTGGPQTLHLGEEFLRNSGCDFLIRGDGEETLFELLEFMVYGRGKIDNIKGLMYLKRDGKSVATEERTPIRDLDSLPFPSSSLILGDKCSYNLPVLSARGCPYRCAFCFEGGNTKALRLRSVESVKMEIRQRLEENPDIKYVWFVDDTFTLNYKRTVEFCQALKELRKDRDFVWFCEGHGGMLARWPELISMMKDAGMVRMQMGMESGWEPALEMYGKEATVAQVEEVIHLCHDADLPQLAGNFIIGGPYETAETLELTSSFVERLIIDTPGLLDISSTFIVPLPNTAISSCPEKFGLTLIDGDSLTSLEDFPVTETADLKINDLSLARSLFLKRVFNTMKNLFKTGRIPHKKIKKHFELALNYGIASTWYKYLYSKDSFVRPYFTMLIKTPALRIEEIPPGLIKSYYPSRVFDMAVTVDRSGGYPVPGERVLSPLEYELLLLCSGKIRLSEICEIIRNKFSDESYSMVEKLLKDFEDRHWILFLPE